MYWQCAWITYIMHNILSLFNQRVLHHACNEASFSSGSLSMDLSHSNQNLFYGSGMYGGTLVLAYTK